MKILTDRMTVERSDGIVVFLIGMRINRWWKIHRWLPVALSMPRMLRELYSKPESGFLGATTRLGFTIQYWSSMDHLLAYAADRSGAHFPAWADFYKKIGTNGDVGIWHETYAAPAGAFESVYVNMPPTGLGRFQPLVPARGHRARARTRLAGAKSEQALPAPAEAARAEVA
jgi:hypothetical protein